MPGKVVPSFRNERILTAKPEPDADAKKQAMFATSRGRQSEGSRGDGWKP